MMNIKRYARSAGFTLIELLVVIAIIGILSAVVLASLNSARQKGRDAARISDVKQLQLALELYYDANQHYPTTIGSTTSSPLMDGNYIASIPVDPQTQDAYQYEPITTGTTKCTTANQCASFVLAATLENTSNSVLDSSPKTDYSTDGPDCATSGVYCVTP